MGIIKRDELLNGVQVTPITFEVTLPVGTYKRGMLLGKVGTVHNLVGETNYPPETIDCVLTEDITLATQGQATAYFEGEFNVDLLLVKEGATLSDVVDHARKLRIFIG